MAVTFSYKVQRVGDRLASFPFLQQNAALHCLLWPKACAPELALGSDEDLSGPELSKVLL